MCFGASWNGRSLMTGMKKTEDTKSDILLGPLGSKVYREYKKRPTLAIGSGAGAAKRPAKKAPRYPASRGLEVGQNIPI